MGAIAEAIAAYAQPLLDQTDGSLDQANRAFTLATLCWNLALLPEARRDAALGEMRPTLKMDDNEFDEFRRSIVGPMIQRHEEMFPRLHQAYSSQPPKGAPTPQTRPAAQVRNEKHARTGRNAP